MQMTSESKFHRPHATHHERGDLGFFLGGAVTDIVLRVQQEWYYPEMYSLHNSATVHSPAQGYHMFSKVLMELAVIPEGIDFSEVQRVLYDPRGFGHRDVGWGHVCKWCGTTYVTGTVLCTQCGGDTEVRDRAVERVKFHAVLAEWDYGWHSARREYNITPNTQRFVLSFLEPPTLSIDMGGHVDWASLIGKWGHFTFPKAYLCPWCGALNNWGRSICATCGGNRLPIKELQNLHRTCWYCGVETVGGYICEGCGEHLARRNVTD